MDPKTPPLYPLRHTANIVRAYFTLGDRQSLQRAMVIIADCQSLNRSMELANGTWDISIADTELKVLDLEFKQVKTGKPKHVPLCAGRYPHLCFMTATAAWLAAGGLQDLAALSSRQRTASPIRLSVPSAHEDTGPVCNHDDSTGPSWAQESCYQEPRRCRGRTSTGVVRIQLSHRRSERLAE